MLFNRVDFKVFAIAVHFTADRSETVQRGNAHGSRRVTVRGTARLHPGNVETFELGSFFNEAGHRLGGFAQGHSSVMVLFDDFLRDAFNPGLLSQLHDLGIDFVVVGIVPDAQIQFGFSQIRYNIGSRTAANHTEIERNTTIPIGQFLHGSDELHHGEDSIATAFRAVAGVSGNTVESDLVGAGTLTSANQFTAFTSRFKNQGTIRLRSAFLQPVVRAHGTGFFIGVTSHENGELIERFLRKILQSIENRHATGFAVQDTRAIGAITLDGHGTHGNSTGGEHRIQVSVQHDIVVGSIGLIRSKKTGTDLVAQVNEFGGKANAFVHALERFSHLLDAIDAGGAGIHVNDLFQVLQKFLNHQKFPF